MATDNDYGTGDKLDEIVFENRNKEYGAYDLRKNYRSILTKSFIIGTIAFILALVAPLAYMQVKAALGTDEKEVNINLEDILDDLPPPVEEEQEQEPEPPPPPEEKPEEIEIVKDMIPEPKPNPKVEEPPKKMDEVKNTTIGTINQEGAKQTTYVAPPPPPPSTGTAKNVEVKKVNPEEIHEDVDQKAEFAGGINKFRSQFQSNFDSEAVDGEGTMQTLITFVVERDGSLTDVKASGPNKAFNNEAIRAVKSVRGKWTPGKINGTPVRSRFKFPVTMKFEF